MKRVLRSLCLGLAMGAGLAAPAAAARIEVDRCAVRSGNSYVTGLTAKRAGERYSYVIGRDVPRRIAFDPWLAERWIMAQIGRPGDYARYTICGNRIDFDDRFPYFPRRGYD